MRPGSIGMPRWVVTTSCRLTSRKFVINEPRICGPGRNHLAIRIRATTAAFAGSAAHKIAQPGKTAVRLVVAFGYEHVGSTGKHRTAAHMLPKNFPPPH